MNELITQDWYQNLIEDCKDIITEAVFTSRWALVEGYWSLGKRLREDSNFSTKLLQDLAVTLNTSERTLWYALQAYDKYPELDKVPEGKNITWNKLITKYLPAAPENKITLELPKGEYDVIYADPPWRYEFSKDSADDIENKYQTLSLQDICEMKVPAAENAVLYLWTTAPKLQEALEVIKAWGFEYKSNMVWDKQSLGMGYWFRGQHELLLVAIKGPFSPPEESLRIPSVYSEKKTKHSRKPQIIYEWLEKWFPNRKYLELFSRHQFSPLWTVYGDQLDSY
jgi:N6-adenosine-specific RNA methylase IME4